MIDHWSVFIPQLGCKNVPTNNTLATPTMAINISKITSAMKNHMFIFIHPSDRFREYAASLHFWLLISNLDQRRLTSKAFQKALWFMVCRPGSPQVMVTRWHSSGEVLFALPDWGMDCTVPPSKPSWPFRPLKVALKHSFPCSLQTYHPTGMNQIKEVYYIYNKQFYVRKLVISLAWTATIDTLFRELVYIEYHEEWPFDGICLHVTSVHRKQTRMPSFWL